jgi:hypothetical protein
VTEIDRMRVPLKVNAITSGVTAESRAWLAYLREHDVVTNGDSEGYRLWHELRMFACRPD